MSSQGENIVQHQDLEPMPYRLECTYPKSLGEQRRGRFVTWPDNLFGGKNLCAPIDERKTRTEYFGFTSLQKAKECHQYSCRQFDRGPDSHRGEAYQVVLTFCHNGYIGSKDQPAAPEAPAADAQQEEP